MGQQRNKRNNVKLEYNGETLTIAEWSERLSINPQTLYKRYSRGLSTEKILDETVQKNSKDYSKPTVELTCGGETHSLTDWAKNLGMKVNTIQKRHSKGWPIDRVLSTTLEVGGKKGG
jgi:hypothetical protein